MTYRDALKARIAAATKGHWVCADIVRPDGEVETFQVAAEEDGPLICTMEHDGLPIRSNRRFIAHSRTDVQTLLRELERLEIALERRQCDFVCATTDGDGGSVHNPRCGKCFALASLRAVLDAEEK